MEHLLKAIHLLEGGVCTLKILHSFRGPARPLTPGANGAPGFGPWFTFICSGHGEGRGNLKGKKKQNRSAQEYQAKRGRSSRVHLCGLVHPSVKDGAGGLGSPSQLEHPNTKAEFGRG